MTHMLHRRGSAQSLKNDFTILAMPARGFTDKPGFGAKLKEFHDVVVKYHPANYGDVNLGNVHVVGAEAISNNIQNGMSFFGVFSSREDLIGCLKELAQKDLGLCTVVSGLFHDVGECCAEAGLQMHTVNQSLGIWGNTDRLPAEEGVLNVSSMCGHGSVSFALVRMWVDRIKKGTTTPEKAGKEIAKMCVCGIFNPVRAADLLRELAE